MLSRESYIIINNEVIYYPNENKLSTVGGAKEKVSINVPVGRCLQLLIENRGRVVSRDDFLEAVWNRNGSYVSQNTFYQNISLLRKSLKNIGLSDDVIVTVRRQGFSLSKDVTIEVVPYPESSLFSSVSPSGSVESDLSSDSLLSSDSSLLSFRVSDIDELPARNEVHVDMKRWRKLNSCLMKAYSEMKYVLIASAIILFFILQVISIYLSLR